MGGDEIFHIEEHVPERMLSHNYEGPSCSAPLRRLSGSERRKSGTKEMIPRSRTSNACEGCRKRKTKCSGSPGPCMFCEGLDTTCIFKPRPHRRSKHARQSDDYLEKHKYILHGVFLILKHNTTQDIQQLIQLIRNDVQPEEIFRCIRANLRLLQERALIEEREIDDDDFFAVAPPMILQGREHSKMDFEKEEFDEVALSKAGPRPTEWELDNSANQTIEGALSSKEDIISTADSGLRQTLPGRSLTYNNTDGFLEAMGFDDYKLSFDG